MSTWISSQGEQDRSGVALDNERGINVGDRKRQKKKKQVERKETSRGKIKSKKQYRKE